MLMNPTYKFLPLRRAKSGDEPASLVDSRIISTPCSSDQVIFFFSASTLQPSYIHVLEVLSAIYVYGCDEDRNIIIKLRIYSRCYIKEHINA